MSFKETNRTLYINFMGGAGCGKSVATASLFVHLKKMHQTCEMIPEYAKTLLWENRQDELADQLRIAKEQNRMLMLRQGVARFAITDGPLANSLYYNRIYPHSSNAEAVEAYVLQNLAKYDHLNLFLTRGDFPYESAGRYQSEADAKRMDQPIWDCLSEHVPLVRLPAHPCMTSVAREVLRVSAAREEDPSKSFTELFNAQNILIEPVTESELYGENKSSV